MSAEVVCLCPLAAALGRRVGRSEREAEVCVVRQVVWSSGKSIPSE